MPDPAPVTIARRPTRSTPATTSLAMDKGPNGVVIFVVVGTDMVIPFQMVQ